MTHRLEQGFRRRFRTLLALVRPRRLDFGVELLMGRAQKASVRDGIPLARALAQLYEFTRVRVERRLVVTGTCRLAEARRGAGFTPAELPRGPGGERPSNPPLDDEAPWQRFRESVPSFLCDRSLSGLGRWLRAAGYDAGDAVGTGDAFLREALADGRAALTSVDDLLDRRLVRDGSLIALWVPTGLTPVEQLTLVLHDLGLPLREPRCMACGGPLVARDKDVVAPRIPPRTARWKDDYWTCASCDRLFWQGTHWQRIRPALESASFVPAPARSA